MIEFKEIYGSQAIKIYESLEYKEKKIEDKYNFITYCSIILDNTILVKEDFKLLGNELISYFNLSEIIELNDKYIIIEIKENNNYYIKIDINDDKTIVEPLLRIKKYNSNF